VPSYANISGNITREKSMEGQVICAVCSGGIPRDYKQAESKACPYDVCGPACKIFASAKTYDTREELTQLWETQQEKEAAIGRFLYGYARQA
jgi:hypothetical protein